MTDSEILRKSPALYTFLPVLYLVWSDAVLTEKEIAHVRQLIDRQEWLNGIEKNFLLSHLDPASPPSPSQLKSWLEEIRKTSTQLSPKTKNSLVQIGMKLARLNSDGSNEGGLEEAMKPLADIEEALGVISGETGYQLNAVERNTMTGSLSTLSAFDVLKMNALLDGEQKMIIDEVKKVISSPDFRFVDEFPIRDYREQVLKWCRQLAEKGYGNRAYPEEYGGKNDMKGYFTIMETLSYHDLSLVIKFGVQFGLFGMSVHFLGTEKHHRKYLRDIGTLKLPGCFAMTETGHGSNVKGIETTATFNLKNQTFTIHTPHEKACKEYIGNAALHGQMATVFAKLIIDGTDYGVNAFLVPLRDAKGNTLAGIRIEDCGKKMGLNGVDNGKIFFDHVVIPKENMLDRYASVTETGEFTSPISSDNRRFFTMLGTLVGGRIGIPRSGLSAAKTGLTIAVKYGNGRRQFGPEGAAEVPILNYQTHQRRLMPLVANAYALHFALQHLTDRFMQRSEEDAQEVEAMAAGLKAYSTWNTTHTLQECRECCGGKGYLSENRIDALKNDTDVCTTFEGDNTVLMQLVAKSRLTEFRQEFSEINFFGIVNYLADQAKVSIQEKNPIIIRSTSDEHLLDPEFHLAAFRYREKSILTSAAQRLKHHIDGGMDSFDAFNYCQVHLVNVGFAYVERLVLEQFIGQVERTGDEGCRMTLHKLATLFALSQIEKNKGWYLEQGYMEGVKTKAIRALNQRLCEDIRKEAVPLVEAFGVPGNCLGVVVKDAGGE